MFIILSRAYSKLKQHMFSIGEGPSLHRGGGWGWNDIDIGMTVCIGNASEDIQLIKVLPNQLLGRHIALISQGFHS